MSNSRDCLPPAPSHRPLHLGTEQILHHGSMKQQQPALTGRMAPSGAAGNRSRHQRRHQISSAPRVSSPCPPGQKHHPRSLLETQLLHHMSLCKVD